MRLIFQDKLGKKYWRIYLAENPLEYDKFISEALKYTEDYKLNFVTKNSEGKYIKYDEIPSKLSRSAIRELVLQDLNDKVSSDIRINPFYFIQKKEQDTLRQLLSKKSKSELLKCINDKDILKNFSYIEKLKNNKVPVLKFRQQPETYEKLQELLDEEAKYYRVPKHLFKLDFEHTFYNPIENDDFNVIPTTFKPTKQVIIKRGQLGTDKTTSSIYDINPSDKGYYFVLKVEPRKGELSNPKFSRYTQKGSLISYSLKPQYRRNIKLIQDNVLDPKYYDIIKPLSDELY